MVSRTLIRYFGRRFVGAVMSVFFGIFVLVVLVDYVEFMRRAADAPNVSAWMVAKASFFRVPQLTERLLPFSVLVGAMACYLALSRRNELVVARSAGMSAWQFVTPALVAAFGSDSGNRDYNPSRPRCANGQSGSRRKSSATARVGMQQSQSGFWVRQKSVDGQSVVCAARARNRACGSTA